MEYRVTATAGAPPAQVYRLFIDVERWPELTQSMRSVRRLDDGPLRVGSEATVRQPRLPSSRWRVTEMEPDRRFTWETSAGGVTTVGDHLVEPDGPGSRITLTLRMHGPLSGVMGLFMGGVARRYASMELEGFRAAADTAAPPAPPGPPAPPAPPAASAIVVIGDRWGVTEAEVGRRYPCDDIVQAPTLQAWRGVTVRAPADRVWPWVTQIRLAPYSYDWIDNLGRRSPRELRGLPEPRAGEPFTAAFAGRPAGRILSVEPGVQLTGLIMGTAMSYVLVPDGGATTRLLLKIAAPGRPAMNRLLCVGDLVMARRQLRTLARLAEAGHRDQGGER